MFLKLGTCAHLKLMLPFQEISFLNVEHIVTSHGTNFPLNTSLNIITTHERILLHMNIP